MFPRVQRRRQGEVIDHDPGRLRRLPATDTATLSIPMVMNIHERDYPVPSADLAALVSTLSSDNDRLWPRERWPRMRLDGGLVVGASGGHGPVRYRVERVDPRGEVVFRFTGPSGFHGWHAFTVVAVTPTTALLRHELRMRACGWALLTWPLFFRPLHDALIEEAFDKAAFELGTPPAAPYRRGLRARLSRAVATRISRSASHRPAVAREDQGDHPDTDVEP